MDARQIWAPIRACQMAEKIQEEVKKTRYSPPGSLI